MADEIQAQTKRCSKCSTVKSLTEFGYNARSKDGLRFWCKVCNRASATSYRKQNSELVKAKSKASSEKNRIKIRIDAAERNKKFPEKSRIRAKIWAKENKERVKINSKKYRQANPEKLAEIGRRRRATKLGAEGHHTANDIKIMALSQKDRCAFCKIRLRGKWHIDHRVALSKGGSNWPNNLQLLCAPCNTSKNSKDEAIWARERLGLLL